MSQAKETFESAISDATSLLERFDVAKGSDPQESTEVLKRASLILTMTAWETYVEDRLRECVASALATGSGPESKIVERLLERDLAALHNPSAEKVSELFRLYAGVDVTENWTWPPFDPKQARRRLNEYLKLRGDAVHRARVRSKTATTAHLVSREKLDKVIRFIQKAVEATDNALAAPELLQPPSKASTL
jgi:hypothetical protein